jgi:CubicO group peptidase (beta-lactamase class C family)
MTWIAPARLVILAVLLLRAAPAPAQAPLDSVDRYVRAELVRQRIPGLSVAVLRGDSLVLARGYGFANLEHRVPAGDSTVYQSGSVGKQFTAAGIVLLAREGRLGLGDPILKHLPEGPAIWRGITIRHLLTHTSGIPDYTEGMIDYRRDHTEDQLLALAARLRPEFEPGATWSYSNTGYMLLGFIIRRVTGQFYGDFLRDRIFVPLGMRTARVISESDIVLNRAAGYRMDQGELKNQEWIAPTINTTADGSLYLTVHDLARWAVGLNHRRVPDAAGLEASWSPVRLNHGGTYPYGFGWALDEQRGYRRIGHTGAWQGFQTSIQRYPEFDLTVIVLANLDGSLPGAISFGIAGILEPALQAPHLLAPRGGGPPEPISALLSGDSAPSRLAPGLRTFASKAVRKTWRDNVAEVERWETLGCDAVAEGKISLLGAHIERICYARAPEPRLLVEVAYTRDWRAAYVDWYFY